LKLHALAFGTHPDDVELACSGTLIRLGAQGYKTGVITLTNGEMGTRGGTKIRTKEFADASKIIGLAVHKMLDIPDAAVEVNQENKIKIIREIRTYKPNIVFAPYWMAVHPDHSNASQLVRESAYLAGLMKLDTGQKAFRPYKVIYYQTRFEFTPSFIVDVSDYYKLKMKSINAYKSQFDHPQKEKYGKEETLVSKPEFLDRIYARDAHYGAYIGVKYGEPFLIREHIKLNDPVEQFGPESLFTVP